MEKPHVFTVFYAWQSDTPQSHCRYLIGDALSSAADILTADLSHPFRIAIDHDTLNETGLCDIPATILTKIDAADAMVVDLTYVAKTAPEKGEGKYCSNPNVLFELGYAFRSMDPKRLVCVMNEKHGPKSEQIFDLDHRRHAIGFVSPDDNRTKAKTIEALADELVNALRPIILKHGARRVAEDNTGRHAADRAKIETDTRSLPSHYPNTASLTFCISPQLYQERRWATRQSLASTLKKRAVRSGSVELPLGIDRAQGMSWGIYCDANSSNNDRWAMTYAGQFWFKFGLPSTADYGIYVPDPSRPTGSSKPPYINVDHIFYEICSAFAVLISLAGEFYQGEMVTLSVNGDGFKDQRLGSPQRRSFTPSAAAITSEFSREFKVSTSELITNWLKYCGDTAQEICEIFTPPTNPFPRTEIDRSLTEIARESYPTFVV